MQPSEQPMIRLDGVGKTYPDGTVIPGKLADLSQTSNRSGAE